MRAADDVTMVDTAKRPGRLAREIRAAVELWLLPAAMALLPYRLGIAVARVAARVLPLYREAAEAGLAQWRDVLGGSDSGTWLAEFRFARLVDHVDLFWALTRSRRFLLSKIEAEPPAISAGEPLLVLSFHYGQGLWLLPWLAAQRHPPRFVSVRVARDDADCWLAYAYARLRLKVVERLSGCAPIFTGGARRSIGDTLRQNGTVYALIDVPVPGSATISANIALFGHPALLPIGLLESASGCGATACLMTATVGYDGVRTIEAQSLGRVEDVALADVAVALERRLERAAAAWHFWHLWPSFHGKQP
jgi:hypothetical protein